MLLETFWKFENLQHTLKQCSDDNNVMLYYNERLQGKRYSCLLQFLSIFGMRPSILEEQDALMNTTGKSYYVCCAIEYIA